MRRIWIVFLISFACQALPARAQTVSPVIVEYREKARGKFEVYNDTLFPLNVVVEPRSFSVDPDGEPIYRPLDPSITVRLSSMSFRLGPKQTYAVFYEASAQKTPAWFTIYSTVTGVTTADGLRIALELPHTVYLLPAKGLERESVVIVKAGTSADKKFIEAELQNKSQDFARVQEIEVTSPSGKKLFPGFPFFPGQKRNLTIVWDDPGQPQMLVLRFQKFEVKRTIQAGVTKP